MPNTSPPPYFPTPSPASIPHDIETASIRSAAPSYTSAAPSYHSTLPLPSSPFSAPSSSSPASLPTLGRRATAPSLSHFTPQSSWSSVRANPTARHYHSVAHRRASASTARIELAARSAEANGSHPVKAVLGVLEEEERKRYGVDGQGDWERLRPLEDPELVGKEAADKARAERLGWGNEVLLREDKRWDWLLSQMKDWEEREKSWGKFRAQVESGKRGRLARRLGL